MFSALEMQFYGKTCSSHLIPLKPDPENSKFFVVDQRSEAYNEFQMFFLTRRKDLDSFIVVDIAMLEKTNDN